MENQLDTCFFSSLNSYFRKIITERVFNEVTGFQHPDLIWVEIKVPENLLLDKHKITKYLFNAGMSVNSTGETFIKGYVHDEVLKNYIYENWEYFDNCDIRTDTF